jgi:hypothetical protein
MQNCARERALVLLETAKRSLLPKDQALLLAQMWMMVAVLEDMLTIWADEVKRETTIH